MYSEKFKKRLYSEKLFCSLGGKGEIAKSLLHSGNSHLGKEFGGKFVRFPIKKVIYQEGNFTWEGVKASSVHLEQYVVYIEQMEKKSRNGKHSARLTGI